MITVVSLNPSIDRTLTLREFHICQTNRADDVRIDAGGKGVNVCLHLQAMGAENVRCVGLMREADAAMFNSVLNAAGVECQWILLPGHVRTNTKVCTGSGELTEINESGAPVPEAALPQLMELCRRAFSDSDVVVLTGSIPPGAPADIYARLIRSAHDAGAVCILDADGEALRLGMDALPELIKPNQAELERLFGRKLPDTDALTCAARELLGMGIPHGCISLGGEGALYFSDGRVFSMSAIDVDVRSTVGAGDAMIAAFALGMQEKTDEPEAFRLAMAAGAAAVTTEGTQPVDGNLVRQLAECTPPLIERK